jgi:glycosyltransferase involved in cell wall biosynthesis
MSRNPLVTVVCPAYNCARFIAPALESVIAQSYRPIEVIVVDDGSTDETPELVKAFSEVRYIRQANRGPSAARNRAIGSAHGEFVAFLDLDDLWTPEKLSEQVVIIDSCPDAGLCFADMRLFSEDADEEPTMFQKYNLSAEYFGHERVVANAIAKLVTMNFIPTSSVVARKTALDQAGGFDERFRKAEDWDLWLRIALYHPIVYSPQLLTLKRVHEVNTSRDAEGMNVAALQVLEKLKRENQSLLTELGVDILSVLRDGYRNLGYFYLRQISLAQARVALWRSLSLGFQLRALIYFLATFLGRGFVGSSLRARG